MKARHLHRPRRPARAVTDRSLRAPPPRAKLTRRPGWLAGSGGTGMLGRARLLALALLVTSCASTARAQATRTQAPTPRPAATPRVEDLQQAYLDLLRREGYSPELDKDGSILFKHEGGRYLIIIDPKDRTFLQLAFPGFWRLETDQDRQKALAAANEASRRTKVIKVVVGKATVFATAEMFLEKPADLGPVLGRCLGGLQLGVKIFTDAMAKK